MNMKPDTKMIKKWWKQASDEFAFTSDGEIRKRFSELAAQWGAEQAQQTTEETDYEFEARQLIGTWLAKEKIKPIGTLRHVYPRCYVVGKAAKSGLIVARPWKDSEEHMKVHTKKYPLSVIHTFDTDLDAGDWCATAYVCHAGVQETVAVGWKK